MKRFLLSAPALAALALAGCAAPHTEVAVDAVKAPALGLSDSDAPRIDTDWWKALGDPQLDHIVDDALSGSPTLQSAMARVRLAQSALQGADAATKPQIAADANEQFERLSSVYIIPPPYGGTFRWVGQAQANLNWNLDFWGQQADAVRQARDSANAAALDYDAARLALAGSVVQTYIELVRAERQIAIAQSTVDQRSQSLHLAKVRVKSQLASNIDVQASQTLLAQAQQAVIRAKGQREQVVHALALLAGQGANYYSTIRPTQLKLDTLLPLPKALPADLLARRPDILSARARIAAAAAGRQVARKAFYPNVNLLGLVGLQALGIGNLFSSDASTYGGGAAIHLPIFEGGKLRADYEGATAKVDAAIASYNQAVLGAVRQTADALSRYHTLTGDLAEQRKAVAGLAEVRRLNNVRVSTGLNSRLDLIGSDVRLLEARQAAANLQADKAVAEIQLLVAVGGGFDPDSAGASTASVTRAAQ
ncbi:efflux transporter outer membrane subunit [Stakelama sediminis]|uniref:NodT family efflux transporter outer membrane factor (OMF) lipoprotein n=1 Tax=Stakelama sediminis TaxID=463200 RepID=A0A840Z1C5_9SPHN|nr:efflux transporter outer membrane subunit [Stakelama sediminis]MBB5719492.1 NodT family efflux transporter outer membrane factor (OMF) lipoprotein [Stakelama sediminis]